MRQHLSTPFESLFADRTQPPPPETIIVGSGYGAALSALALAERGAKRIWVLERGNEFVPGEFPPSFGALPGQVSITTREGSQGSAEGLWDVRHGAGMTALVGRGLGGGSLVNANVAFDLDIEQLAAWPRPEDTSVDEWTQGFLSSRERVQRALDPRPVPHAKELSKFQALEHMAKELDPHCAAIPAALTVRYESKPNHLGVHQNACNYCGNCVSGCNTGAKGSLDMNVWPLLVSHGVRIYTGATVVSLQTERGCWFVSVRCTRTPSLEKALATQRVILAAGAFGSAEILRRSSALPHSTAQVGKGFNGNGDILEFSEGSPHRVHGMAATPSTTEAPAFGAAVDSVGPTIVGYVNIPPRTGSDGTVERPGFLLEDGAIPFPLRRLAEEVLVTKNFIRRLSDGTLPTWTTKSPQSDPSAGTLQAGMHQLSWLVMGRASGTGHLEFSGDALIPHWNHTDDALPRHDYFREITDSLWRSGRAIDTGRAPKKDDRRDAPIRELNDRTPHVLTVHPLGGCRMATQAESGVVDPTGAVFSSSTGTATHKGLYVLDGSIFPEAIGVNPFLTIATLAHFLASRIPLANEEAVRLLQVLPPYQQRAPARNVAPLPSPADESVRGCFCERFFLKLTGGERDALLRSVPALEGRTIDALVIDAQMETPPLGEWLTDPSRRLAAKFTLSTSPIPFGSTVPTTALVPWESFDGHVIFGGLDRGTRLGRFVRCWAVLGLFLRIRGTELLAAWVEVIRASLLRRLGRNQRSGKTKIWSHIKSILSLARVQTERRFMSYEFEGRGIRFWGQKKFAYQGREPDPLKILTELPFVLRGNGGAKFEGVLAVDLIRLTGSPTALQVEQSPDLPSTIGALSALVLFFVRGILTSMFWSFRRPVYERFGTRFDENSERLVAPPQTLTYRADGQALPRDQSAQLDVEILGTFGLPPSGKKEERTNRAKARTARLVRYRAPFAAGKRRTALLIHGLAHGTRVFYTETIPTPMAASLLSQGYDVWLLDHGLSINLHREPSAKTNIDDLGKEDIPWAVRSISVTMASEAGSDWEGVHVFAHCIGAAAFAMSVLSGHLSGFKIAALAVHAVTPWLIASKDNRWRANALSLFKDYWAEGYFDPIPHDDPTRSESLYDALAGSFSWGEDRKCHERHERGDGFSRTICNRMTLFYGQEWLHENLAPETHRDLASLVGPGSLEVMRQAYFCVVRGRLTDRNGRAIYVRQQNFEKYWDFPTLFLHGSQNKVFDAEASRRSAHELALLFAGPRFAGRKVAVQIVPGYGHMDALFGKDAHRDIFPKIVHFFEHHEVIDQRLCEKPEAYSAFLHAEVPEIGPIISRPQKSGDTVTVQVWAATNQLAVKPVQQISLQGKLQPNIKPKSPRRRNHPCSSVALHAFQHAPLVQAGPHAERSLGHQLQEQAQEIGGPCQEAHDFWVGRLPLEPPVKNAYAGFFPTAGKDAERSPVMVDDWHELPWVQRLLHEDLGGPAEVSFLVGSCLHPGLGPERNRSDRIFCDMLPHLRGTAEDGSGRGVDHLLILGDFIYADAFGEFFDPHSPLERFRMRYAEAMGGPASVIGTHAQFLMSRLPTYFSLDDHEIRNDWFREATGEPELLAIDEAALDAAYDFLIHDDGAGPGAFFQSFESGGCPFFLFDTRTQRTSSQKRSEVRALICPSQKAAFEAWIKTHGDDPTRPLFIATGASLGPLLNAEVETPEIARNSDGLLGFPGFLVWLTDQLSLVKASRIVWLAGDLHTSCVCEIELQFDGREPVRLVQIVASGLFAPLPFINTPTQSYLGEEQEVRVQLGGLAIRSRQQPLVPDGPASFVRVDCKGTDLAVTGVVGSASQGQRGFVRTFA